MTMDEVLRETDRRDTIGRRIRFQLMWVEYDRGRKRGGRLRNEKELERCGSANNLRRSRQITVRRADGTGHPWPVHIRAITRYNNQPVHL